MNREAPPNPRLCSSCGGDGIYRCTECAHRPVLCTSCCREVHRFLPFHRVEQWNGTFFEESSLRMVSTFFVGLANIDIAGWVGNALGAQWTTMSSWGIFC